MGDRVDHQGNARRWSSSDVSFPLMSDMAFLLTFIHVSVKHYIANEQERNRTTSSSNIDDRTMREIYTHPFLRAVAADVASVMCSYNLVNNSWACQNEETLNGILKTDFGFQGYVMSDWAAIMSGVS